MTERLYYHDSFLYDFEARVVTTLDRKGRPAVILDRTAFYPTSGGQIHDTGALILADHIQVPVVDVEDAEQEDGILHFVTASIAAGATVRGTVDAARRRDHMQQHSGQHLLSAALIRLFDIPTVSFHMGEGSCTIDLETQELSAAGAEQAEKLANEIIAEDRPVSIRFTPLEAAHQLKLPPKQKGDLRLIEIADFDLTACGGTHVRSTGQIGAILIRKVEKAKQGVRLEFVCGLRAVATARKDYMALSQAAAVYSAHIHDVPQQARKSLEENRAAGKVQHKLLGELAEIWSEQLLARATGSPRVIACAFPERDAAFIKLLAQRLTSGGPEVVALLAAGSGQPALVFAQSPKGDASRQKRNMGELMKDVMARMGGRGGGTSDMAQGGLSPGSADPATIEKILRETAAKL